MANFEKEPEIPDSYGKGNAKRWWVLGLIATVLAGGAGYWGWQTTRQKTPPAVGSPDAQAGEKIAFVESRLQIIRETLAEIGPAAPAETTRRLVEEGVSRQSELMRLRPNAGNNDDIELHEWQTRLDEINVAEWTRQSRALEQRAEELLVNREHAAAIEAMSEALRLQRQVNASSARQGLKNYSRESRLQQDLERVGAEPLRDEVQKTLARAQEATAAKQWREATEAYEKARRLQLTLNQEFARTRYANAVALDRIESELANLAALEANDELLATLARADSSAKAGQLDDAEKLLASAAEQQRAINEKFPKSRFVSLERLAQLDVQRETWRAGVELTAVRDLDRRIAELLRRRELFPAQQLVSEALKKLESMASLYPKAEGMDEDLKQRLGYLALRQSDLVQIQDQVYDLLVPLPGHLGRALMRTEVSQDLFSRVMNTNPSRNVGRLLPVDSVTYGEAEEFCRRVGWVLGASVRLPTEEEFRTAVGDVKASAAQSWSQANANGKSQPPNQKSVNAVGYADTMGNLAEFLASAVAESASIAGGSYLDDLTGINSLPIQTVPKATRARTQGFRAIAEIDLSKPAGR